MIKYSLTCVLYKNHLLPSTEREREREKTLLLVIATSRVFFWLQGSLVHICSSSHISYPSTEFLLIEELGLDISCLSPFVILALSCGVFFLTLVFAHGINRLLKFWFWLGVGRLWSLNFTNSFIA